MKIFVNGKEIKEEKFAFGGCHKFYTLETSKEEIEVMENGYHIYSIEKLPELYKNCYCDLKFIDKWEKGGYVCQGEKAIFEIKY